MIVINMKKVAALVSCSLVTMAANAAVLPATQTDSLWFKTSAQLVSDKTLQTNKTQAKNVILFVGDGMGISTLTAARI